MKNQYFGDLHDYRKYGLLRGLTGNGAIESLVSWMLTPDDLIPNSSVTRSKQRDGEFRAYLEDDRFKHHDEVLYLGLKAFGLLDSRQVSTIESSGLLPGAAFFSSSLHVPLSPKEREAFFLTLLLAARSRPLVFFDPDNGLEVTSATGSKRAKYLLWQELEQTYNAGHSILVYQHFVREDRNVFINKKFDAFRALFPTLQNLSAFQTPHVVYFLLVRPEHEYLFHDNVSAFHRSSWCAGPNPQFRICRSFSNQRNGSILSEERYGTDSEVQEML